MHAICTKDEVGGKTCDLLKQETQVFLLHSAGVALRARGAPMCLAYWFAWNAWVCLGVRDMPGVPGGVPWCAWCSLVCTGVPGVNGVLGAPGAPGGRKG
eukprot:5538907-Pyramimonas_sp.AAC.1